MFLEEVEECVVDIVSFSGFGIMLILRQNLQKYIRSGRRRIRDRAYGS